MMNTSKLSWALALGASLALGGCWGDDDVEPAPVVITPPEVVPPVVVVPLPEVLAVAPDSAGLSAAAFLSFVRGFNPADEANQPLTFKPDFAVPADETSEPQLLT